MNLKAGTDRRRTVRLRSRIWCVLLVAQISGPASAEQWKGLLDDMLAYLKMDQQTLRERLDTGKIIYTGMPQHAIVEEEIAVGGALMLLRAHSPQVVVNEFISAESLVNHMEFSSAKHIHNLEPSFFDTVELPKRDLNLLTKKKVAKYFNLSINDIATVNESKPPQIENYRAMLHGRLSAYLNHGLHGIEPYSGNKRRYNPALEIQSAIRGADFLKHHFPEAYQAIMEFPKEQSSSIEDHFLLIERDMDNRRIHAIARQVFEVTSDAGIGADIQFYVSANYNAMFVLIGVVPYKNGSLVFALLHIFTDEVVGFGSGLKKSIGTKQAAEFMTQHFARIRQTLD
jgi:hypothetical protein